jgi:hypothetical protein
MRFAVANMCTAFAEKTIGTKVKDGIALMAMLREPVEKHKGDLDQVPGQHFIRLDEARHLVSAGVGRARASASYYVLRTHRGEVKAFLERDFAAQVETLSVVVYTREAYNADPDVVRECHQVSEDFTHVIAAVLASAGPQSPLTPERFVHNLAGGNKEALLWSANEIRERAADIVDYWREWSVVAD